MPTRIDCQNGAELIADDWTLLPREPAPELPTAAADFPKHSLLPLSAWLSLAPELQAALLKAGDCGVWLDSDEDPALLSDEACARLPLIAVNFPLLADGRGFSIGRLLAEQRGFDGELRAIGHFIPDQLFYLRRCGFNSFLPEQQQHMQDALGLLQSFDVCYQGAVEPPLPLYRHRQR